SSTSRINATNAVGSTRDTRSRTLIGTLKEVKAAFLRFVLGGNHEAENRESSLPTGGRETETVGDISALRVRASRALRSEGGDVSSTIDHNYNSTTGATRDNHA